MGDRMSMSARCRREEGAHHAITEGESSGRKETTYEERLRQHFLIHKGAQ
jgi:hypothetical protein